MPIYQSDQDLVKLYLNGSEVAFETLIRKHKDKVFAFILSKIKNYNLAHDVFQDTFIKVINSLKRGKYNEEGKFVPWVMRIAHNLVIDHFRRQKKTRSIAPTDDFNIFDVISNEEKNAEENMITDQITSDVRKLIEELPEDQKEVLKMRYYRDMSFKEIAEITDVSINTALGRMRYAVINLRKLVEKYNIQLEIN
ncbi:MAG: sigma-70 family RNA polymerase sigma factor [Flavobacteriales bacterium]|jgi:RNA polymerase sigma-70 factor (ECF subfamily)|nr:sigma-70 family RNA polymerase sigma factor [Flavobacteriales bacterium]